MAKNDASPLGVLEKRAPYSWLRERDIDLLVCAELHARGQLTQLFATRLGVTDADFVRAWVSHAEPDGESDLIVAFSVEDGLVAALVENKIAAPFQPNQAERYTKRARRLAASDGIARVVTLLVAPDHYADQPGTELFDLRVTYEEMTTVLRTESDGRARFLAQALEAGVERCRRGYVMTPDDAVSEFWTACWGVAQKLTPRLNFKKPSLRPSGSSFIYLNGAEGLQKGIDLVYKAAHGHADLQFSKTSVRALAEAAEGLLDSNIEVVKAGESASIRIAVPPVDFRQPAEEQRAAIVEGLAACERLRALFAQHGKELRQRLAG